MLGKTTYGNNDSVKYTIEQCEQYQNYLQPEYWTTFDTITETYNFIQLESDSSITRLTDEFIGLPGVSGTTYGRSLRADNRQIQYVESGLIYYYSGCWGLPPEPANSTYGYAGGLGQTYTDWVESGSTTETSESLVYYKKGNQAWGTPVYTDCSTMVDIKLPAVSNVPSIQVIPNPAQTQAEVMIGNYRQTDGMSFILYNSSGKNVERGNVGSGHFFISRNNLPEGLYLLLVTGKNGEVIGKSKIVFAG